MELKYSKSHEWIKETDDNTVIIGITEFAQSELGEIVFVNLFEVGDEVELDEPFGDVESVKAVSDLVSPVSGTIVKVNENLLDSPELVNENANEAWMIEVENYTLDENLMTLDEYNEFIEG
ncbi:MAG TPA: glycine cleavage system protein GcvH [Erysipelothrix sp.]|jgi:glycine cleavage system H protein|nr:glycine cleavage system protein GcvH [Erysipelothrix sp.]